MREVCKPRKGSVRGCELCACDGILCGTKGNWFQALSGRMEFSARFAEYPLLKNGIYKYGFSEVLDSESLSNWRGIFGLNSSSKCCIVLGFLVKGTFSLYNKLGSGWSSIFCNFFVFPIRKASSPSTGLNTDFFGMTIRPGNSFSDEYWVKGVISSKPSFSVFAATSTSSNCELFVKSFFIRPCDTLSRSSNRL